MRFVVGTHSYLLLVTVSESLDVTDTVILDRGYFDGADVFDDGTIIACYKTDPWSKRSPTGFRFYDENGAISVPPIDGSDILDPHQLTLDADQRGCWNCSTATNELVYKSLRDSRRDRRFWFEGAAPGQNWNHINSISASGNLVDVLFHNWGREPSEVRQFRWGESTLVERERFELAHYSVHNFETIDPDFVAYNASDNGRIMRGCWGRSDCWEECHIGDQWHPKGMAVTNQYVVSGYSEHAVSTPRRFVSESGLAFVDRQSWALARLTPIILPSGRFVGNVNEIRHFPDTATGARLAGAGRAEHVEVEKRESGADLGPKTRTLEWDEA